MDLKKLFDSKMDRRKMINNVAMMGVGATIAACTPAMRAEPEPPPMARNFDPAILTFALNLEYLEAAFYLAAVGRIGEVRAIGGNADIILPEGFNEGTGVDFNALGGNAQAATALEAYANELANEELVHTQFLFGALQAAGVTVSRPVINLDTSFKAAAAAAFQGVNPGDVGLPMEFTPNDFDPLANGAFFVHGAFIFEDVGVTAYKGAARFLTNPDFLEAAAGILAAEAYHSGNIRTFLHLADKSLLDFYGGLNTHAIVNAISAARDALDGSGDKDQGITDVDIVTASEANIAVTDENGIAFSRTPLEVARIVALSPDAQFGDNSFFPNSITIPDALAEDFGALLDPNFPNNL
jgi:hypothetical protein